MNGHTPEIEALRLVFRGPGFLLLFLLFGLGEPSFLPDLGHFCLELVEFGVVRGIDQGRRKQERFFELRRGSRIVI